MGNLYKKDARNRRSRAEPVRRRPPASSAVPEEIQVPKPAPAVVVVNTKIQTPPRSETSTVFESVSSIFSCIGSAGDVNTSMLMSGSELFSCAGAAGQSTPLRSGRGRHDVESIFDLITTPPGKI